MRSLQAKKIVGWLGPAVLLAMGACILCTSRSMAAPANSVAAAKSWSVLERWKLGGPGGWDYLTLDAAGKRLFISRGDHVDVINTQTGVLLGSIPDTKGVHGIALAEGLNRGYTSNGRGDSITAFELDTLKVVKEVPVSGHNPDAILYEPVFKRVFTFNGSSKDVTVIDASSFAILATIPVPDKPEFAVEDGAGQVFVNIESEAGQMVVIDSRKLAITATWALPGCASPSGLAIDTARHRLFSVCDAKIMAITDAVSGKQVAKVQIGEGPDATAYDAKRGLAFSSNGEGTLTIIHQVSPDRYSTVETLKTQQGARTMALDSVSGRIYLVTADFGMAPSPSAEQPHPRPPPIPDSFTVLVVGAR
jgi:DNA-binding beta-propeller fold protein YncE